MKKCAACESKVLQETSTAMKLILHICPNCRGTWSTAGGLARLTGNPTEFERQFAVAKRNSVDSDKCSPMTGAPMLEIPLRGKHQIYYCKNSEEQKLPMEGVTVLL